MSCIKLTQDEFIKRAKNIHGDKYIFDKAIYKGIKQKVIVICPRHGEFLATPDHLLLGKPTGCNQCGIDSHYYTTEEYIKTVKSRHKKHFDYSLVIYKDRNTPIVLICDKSHRFTLKAGYHLFHGGRCTVCHPISRNLELFIIKAKEIHGDRYDYSKAIYTGSKNKLIISCKQHGDFLIDPNSHLNRKGCPECNTSKGESAIQLFLNRNNICFIKEKTFRDCRDKGLLRFDFYLPDFNTCIEFDGYWHFNTHPSNLDGFNKVIRRDRIKNIYCRENHIPLIRISSLKNIGPTLTNILKL